MSRRSRTSNDSFSLEQVAVPYRLFFESSNDAVLIATFPDGAEPGLYVEVNKAACDLLGYTREELISMVPQDIHAEPVPPESWQSMKRDLQEEGLARFERQLLSADGRRIPVEMSCRVFWEQGQRFVLAICQDLSQQLLNERVLRDRQRDLVGLINASEDSASLVESDTRILLINRSGAERFRATPDELVGKRILELSPESIRSSRSEVARRVVENGETIVFDDFREGMHLHHTVAPVRDDEGAVSRFAIFSRDITDQVLRQTVDNILNALDRQILAGEGHSLMFSQVCEQLQQVFHSPWVAYFPDHGDDFISVGEAERIMRPCCRNRALMPDSGADAPYVDYLGFGQSNSPDSSWLFRGLADFNVQHAVVIGIGSRHENGGVIILTTQFPRMIDSELARELFSNLSSRLSLALEMQVEQQQLMLLRKALESARNALFIANRDGHIIWTNEAFLDMCGYAMEEVMGATPSFLRPGQLGEQEYSRLWTTILGGQVWSGEILDRRKDGREYTVLQTITPVLDKQGEITHFIAIQEDISDRKRDEARVRYLADHCPLTDLHNRRFLMNALRAVHRRTENGRNADMVAILYLDIDLFKQVNDRFGHDVGDMLLKGFAERLLSVVRKDDIVARLGGDEFVILLRGVGDSDLANCVAQKILDSLRLPITCEGMEFSISSSIGIAVTQPDQPWQPEVLLRQADNAMYRAKALGRNRYTLYPRVDT